MKRWVYAYRTVAGDPEELDKTLRTRLEALLEEAASRSGSSGSRHVDGSFALRLDAPVLGAPAKTIRVALGVASQRDGRLRVPLQWHAEPARLAFPQFDGILELEPLSGRFAQLTIVGSCAIPLGPVGAAVDATVLAGAAQRTADRLVARLADALEAAAQAPEPPSVTASPPELRVADVMTPNPVILDPDLPLRAAALLLFHRRIRGAPVVAGDGELIGVLSETDVLHYEAGASSDARGPAARAAPPREPATVGEVCSRPARITVPDASLKDAARELIGRGVGRLVVVKDARIVGIVTRHDVLSSLIRSDVELGAAIKAALAAVAEPGATATVRWGEAQLSGTVSTRSRALEVTQTIADIDGVTAVESRLSWREDDAAHRSAGSARGGRGEAESAC